MMDGFGSGGEEANEQNKQAPRGEGERREIWIWVRSVPTESEEQDERAAATRDPPPRADLGWTNGGRRGGRRRFCGWRGEDPAEGEGRGGERGEGGKKVGGRDDEGVN